MTEQRQPLTTQQRQFVAQQIARHQPNRYSIAAIIITAMLLVGLTIFNVWYTKTTTSEEGQKFCKIVGTLNVTYRRTPPSTPSGQEVAKEMNQLERDLGCEGTHKK